MKNLKALKNRAFQIKIKKIKFFLKKVLTNKF